jgi:enoyl-[acyl-carrier-protein] reductase (NADH)
MTARSARHRCGVRADGAFGRSLVLARSRAAQSFATPVRVTTLSPAGPRLDVIVDRGSRTMHVLEGMNALVVGVANDRSIAWGCARAFHRAGARVALTYLNDKARPHVAPLAEALDAPLLLPLDVTSAAQTDEVFAAVGRTIGRLDIVLHSIAFCPKEDLHARVVDVSREGFLQAMDVSVHSFVRLVRGAEPLMTNGGTCMTVTFYGSTRVVDRYNVMGPVKAALVATGAPLWAGEVGENPMRYNAGVIGGTWLPMLLSDLGGGVFDGAHLVMNFELLNPGRTMFRKYADLFRDVDNAEATFLEFEKWWGGFFLMTEPEIRWIVEQLFVGNRLVKNEARIEPGRPIDLKAIKAPIIVFASHGDNITPPQQALNWIAETYADVAEIKIRGQRIVYMVHDKVGHLGIFVSSQIANREHTEVASTLKTIESLAPGLYEMVIEDDAGEGAAHRFTVGFTERTLDDLRRIDDGHADERPFAAVARTSEIQAQVYDALVRPLVRGAITDSIAEFGRAAHPLRLQRALVSSRNPLLGPIEMLAERTRAARAPASRDNPFLKAEALWVDAVEQSLDFWRDSRDMMTELAFHATWGTPWARAFGRSHDARRTLESIGELAGLPEVTAAIFNIDRGGFVEAVVRMLVLLADARGTVRRDRLERASYVLTKDEPFASLTAERRAMIIHEQTLIATYEPERAIDTLPLLPKTKQERELAARVVRYIPGAITDMTPHTLSTLQRFHAVLDLPLVTDDVVVDPLAPADAGNGVARVRALVEVPGTMRDSSGRRAPAANGDDMLERHAAYGAIVEAAASVDGEDDGEDDRDVSAPIGGVATTAPAASRPVRGQRTANARAGRAAKVTREEPAARITRREPAPQATRGAAVVRKAPAEPGKRKESAPQARAARSGRGGGTGARAGGRA